MKPKDGFVAFVLDQLDEIEGLRSRSMFSGVGLYAGDVFFGIIYFDVLYFKVDDSTRGRYERAGMKPFKPFANRPMTLQYYEVPARVLEDREALVAWARKAIDVGSRSQRRGKKRRGTNVYSKASENDEQERS